MKQILRLMGVLCPKRKPKILIKSLASYVLYLATIKILFCVCLAHARQQGLGTPVATGVALSTDSIKPLQIGDSIPSALWLPLQMVKVGQEGATTVTLNDYKGKLIILDFWATWCSSCLATIPKMEALQQQFQNEIAVMPLTYENAAIALPVMQRNKWTLPSIIQGELFKQYFPHRFIPHYIWIKNGRVYGITDSEELTSDKISLALKPSRLDLKEKRDLARNPFMPIDRYATQQGAKVYVRTVLTGFIEGTGGSGRTVKNDTTVFYQFNRPIIDIYRSALHTDHNRILLETDKPEKLLNRAFDKEYLYAYQLLLPADADDKMIENYVTQDLNTSFGINGRWESVKRKCYVIKDIKGEKGKEKEGTLSLTKFLKQLNYSQQWYPDLPIFVNAASKDVKITLPARATTLKQDIPALKKLLASYNLQLAQEVKEIPMFILSDYHN